MATIALQAVGNAIVPGVGGIVGAFIGNFIDQNIIFPALFPQDPQEGPKVDDLQLNSSAEGSGVPLIIGIGKAPGRIIYISDLREVAEEEEVGKGGGGQEVTTYTYFLDIAYVYNRRETSRVVKIWAEGEEVYNADVDVNLTSTQLSADVTEEFENPTFPAQVTKKYVDINSPNGGPDLSVLKSGNVATLSGWSDGALNGTFKCVSSSFDSLTGTSTARFKLSRTSTAADESAGNSITVVQDNPELSPSFADGITFYPGSQTQLPDPTMEADLGAGNVPAYFGRAYCVIQSMNVTGSGGRPRQLSFLVEEDATRTIAQAIDILTERTGRPSSEFDTSAISGALDGVGFVGRRSSSAVLNPFMLAFDIRPQETDSKIKFLSRTNLETIVVDADDLAAHPSGGDAPRNARFTDRPSTELPKRLAVNYVDKDAEYQTGSQVEVRIDAPTDRYTTVQLPFAMRARDGRCIAKKLLWTAWANRTRVQIQLPISYIRVQESDLVEFEVDGETYTMIVDQVDRGADYGLIKLEGVIEESEALDFDPDLDCVADEADLPDQVIYIPPELELFVLLLPPLQDDQLSTYGFYYALAAEDSTALYGGATLYESTDAGATFNALGNPISEATLGRVTEELGAPVYPNVWDRANTLNIRLIEGALFSRSEEDVLKNGLNRMVVGGEIIGFANATQETDGTWTIDTLLRGQRGTEAQVDQHTEFDRVVLLNSSGVTFQTRPLTALNSTRSYKAVPRAGVVADFEEQVVDLAVDGANLKPFSVVDVQGSRDGSDNLTVTWTRRTRAIVKLLTGPPIPLAEDSEEYEVDILDAPGGNVLRTITGLTSPTASYTAAEQTTDGLTPGDPVDVVVYQLSEQVGRGTGQAEEV